MQTDANKSNGSEKIEQKWKKYNRRERKQAEARWRKRKSEDVNESLMESYND